MEDEKKKLRIHVEEGFLVLDAYATGVVGIVVILSWLLFLSVGIVIGWLIK